MLASLKFQERGRERKVDEQRLGREIFKKIANILKKKTVMRKYGVKGISRKKKGHRIKNKHWEQRKNEKREEIHQNNKNRGGTIPSYSSLNEVEKLK